MPAVDIRAAAGGLLPAGPSFSSQLSRFLRKRSGPVAFMTRCAQEYGDLVHYRAGGHHVFQFNHPDLVQELLINDAKFHHRGLVMQKSKLVLGEGLLTSEEPLHMRQRRLAQPAFHRDRISAYGRIIGRYAEDAMAHWQDGEVRDLHDNMQLLALRIVGKTLFDSELEADNRRIASAIDAFMSFLPLTFLPFSDLMQKLPIPLMRRIRRSRVELDTLIYSIIQARRADGVDRGDLLSMLLSSVDQEENTGSMSDMQVRDECVTALLAGNETTANGLSFAFWLLAIHPEAQEHLHQEACAVLGDRTATAEDYPRLRYAWMCFAEGMRIYPPVWVTARTSAVEYECRGFRIPEGSMLLAPQVVVHRDTRFYEEPMRFDPTRFEEAARAERPRMAYFPFAAGSRQCIGEGLAWMEGVLVLATLARSWRVEPLQTPTAELEVEAKVTMRPKHGLPLRLTRR